MNISNLLIWNLSFTFILHVEILKAKATSATTIEGKLEVKGPISKTLNELGSL
jgi:hypothetical protein